MRGERVDVRYMYRQDKQEFKNCIQKAIWDYLDRLANYMDKVYARKGVQKRVTEDVKKGRPRLESDYLDGSQGVYTMHKSKWEKMSAVEQWQWVFEHFYYPKHVELGNDATYLILDEDVYFKFKRAIGNSDGILDLLHAAGIKAKRV